MKNLGEIESTVFKHKIILMLDVRWREFFEQNNIKFEAKIDKNGKYTLTGPMVRQHHQYIPTAVQEDTVDE